MAQQGTPPFMLELEQVNAPNVPAIHSFAKAQWMDKWVLLTGRIDVFTIVFFPNSAFSLTEANSSVFVIDTNSWQVWSASLLSLPYELYTPLRSTNAQFFQNESELYIIGGFGTDSLIGNKVTFSTLTAIDVDGLIAEIISGGNNLLPFVRQINDSLFKVTGGKIEKLNDWYYLIGGNDFEGLYTKDITTSFTQAYTNSITRFQLNDDGSSLAVDNIFTETDTLNFHRRDLNSAPVIYPDGTEGFAAYGGVFQYDKNLPYQSPIYISATGIDVDEDFEQKMSQYTCPVITSYDSVTQTMYSTFMGGIGLYDYNDTTNMLVEDTLVPFVNDISTLIRYPDGSTEEFIWPLKLPGLYGSNAEFFPNKNLPCYENGVLKLRATSGKQLVGYFYGGITTNQPNQGYSVASNLIFRVFITLQFATGIEGIHERSMLQVFPNPASGETQISFYLEKEAHVILKVNDAFGTEIMNIAGKSFLPGEQQLHLNTRNLAAGVYSLQLIYGDRKYVTPLVVVK
jgi:hypothetical protein